MVGRWGRKGGEVVIRRRREEEKERGRGRG